MDISQDTLLRLSLYDFPAFYIIWPWGSATKGKASTFPQYLAAAGQWSPLFALGKFLMLSLVNVASNNWLTWYVAVGANGCIFALGKFPFLSLIILLLIWYRWIQQVALGKFPFLSLIILLPLWYCWVQQVCTGKDPYAPTVRYCN